MSIGVCDMYTDTEKLLRNKQEVAVCDGSLKRFAAGGAVRVFRGWGRSGNCCKATITLPGGVVYLEFVTPSLEFITFTH